MMLCRNVRRTDNRALALIATKIIQRHPTWFVSFCTCLAEEAERAIRSNRSPDMHGMLEHCMR